MKKIDSMMTLKKNLEIIEKQKNEIAEHRDKMRAAYEEAEDILNALDTGIDGINSGLLDIRGGIDEMSQYL